MGFVWRRKCRCGSMGILIPTPNYRMSVAVRFLCLDHYFYQMEVWTTVAHVHLARPRPGSTAP
eukprot:364917-Chlamydomonas_euryale.AAC.3